MLIGPLRPGHLIGAILLVPALLLSGCSDKEQGGMPDMTPEVGVYHVFTAPQVVTLSLPGRTTAHMIAQIRPQVGGIIKQRLFEEGDEVRAGQALYQIDPKPYQAALAQAKATVASAEATLHAAELKAKRDAELVKIDAISAETNENSQSSMLQARASLLSARASEQTAQINLDYTRITAPISGRTSTSSVTPGALVTADQDTALTSVQRLDPIYVDVTQTSADLLRLKRDLAAGRLAPSDQANATTIQLKLEDGSNYPEKGTLTFNGNTVDEGTGSVTLRALVPNPDDLLMPGMYVKAEIEGAVQQDAILVPQQGVTRNERGEATALVVVDGKVEQRTLELVQAIGNKWWVQSGLQAGDQLIVEGVQNVQPGQTVKPVDSGTGNTPAAETKN